MSYAISATKVSVSLARRSFVRGAGLAAFATAAGALPAAAQSRGAVSGQADWSDFKRRFVTADGRVIDTGNNGCTHTEGQGLGMLFAIEFNDPDTFDSLLGWTAKHLRRPYDRLHGWRYQPNATTPVADWNNATDGDLFIAAALHRASIRWGRPDHAVAAAALARDILRLLVREMDGRTVLLPGAQGFDAKEGLTVNLSYYAFPLLAELAEVAPSPLWQKLRDDGLALIEQARFGTWQLPSDWLLLSRGTGTVTPHPHWPARFSYDAIRIPLYLSWGRVAASHGCSAFCSWATGHGAQPAWVDLKTNATADYTASAGQVAVARLAAAAQQGNTKAEPPDSFPSVRTSTDYYSAALVLLARIAWRESREEAVHSGDQA